MTNKANAPFFVDLEVIRLMSDGRWMSDETEITHEATRKLFSRNLVKTGGRYFLKVANESKEVLVEDTPYFVVRLEGSNADGWKVILNDDSEEELIPNSLKYHPGRLTCRVKGGESEARFLRAPYYELLGLAEETPTEYRLKTRTESVVLSKKI